MQFAEFAEAPKGVRSDSMKHVPRIWRLPWRPKRLTKLTQPLAEKATLELDLRYLTGATDRLPNPTIERSF